MATSVVSFPPPHPHLTGPLFRAPLLSGDAGTEQTISKMRELVDSALRNPSIIRLAKDIVASAPAYNETAEAQAIYNWVLSNIRFTRDPVSKETLYPPAELLKIRSGDCDDISMLVATLLMAVGIPARLVTVSANPSSSDFSHVYAEGQIEGEWTPIDPARVDSAFGQGPAMYFRKRAWSLTDSGYDDLQGLGYYPRFRSHLGQTQYPATDEPYDYTTPEAMVATVAQGAANIIAASNQPYNPWSSFATQYSPYGTSAGYSTSPLASSSISPTLLIVLGVGVLLLATLGGGGRR